MATATETELDRETGVDIERMRLFTDAVFAIAITLLVIDLRLPENATLEEGLYTLPPKVLSFIISFLVVGSYWVAYHRYFRFVERLNGRLVWLNLFFLMGVVFMPFPTALIGPYGNQQRAVVLYAASVALVGMLMTLMWLYAAKNGLLTRDLSRRFVTYYALRSVLPPIIFILSMGLTYLNPYLAEASWVLIYVDRAVLSRVFGYRR
jgi:uncharacterized membrane protein